MWTKVSERQWEAKFGCLDVMVLCPNTESIPEQHNKWLLMCDIGEYGILEDMTIETPIADVLRSATYEISMRLSAALADANQYIGK